MVHATEYDDEIFDTILKSPVHKGFLTKFSAYFKFIYKGKRSGSSQKRLCLLNFHSHIMPAPCGREVFTTAVKY